MNEFMRRVLMLPEQASTVSREIDILHYVVISATTFGAIAVALCIGYFTIRYRETAHRGREQEPDTRAHHAPGGMPILVEIGVFGGLLVLFVGFWIVGYRQYVKLRVPPADSMQIYVAAKKWMWSFAYPDGRGSQGVLYVPVGVPIELVMTSRDVIHSFYVPAFRVKQDVVPGRTTTAWFEATRTGTYDILCAEYCGTGHSGMRATVVVLAAADYDRMTRDRSRESRAGPETDRSLAALGERIANQYGCFRCHTADGTPHIGPSWARLYRSTIRTTDDLAIVADAAYITESIMDPMARIHAGYQPVMPTYQGLIQAGEIAAIVEYIRSLESVSPTGKTPLPAAAGAVEIPGTRDGGAP